MPELPSVSEDFNADASGYLAALQEMINRTRDLINEVNELHAIIDSLPDVKNIEINVTGDALEVIELIKTDLDSLEDRTVIVSVVYKTLGDQPAGLAEQTELVKQVVIPAAPTGAAATGVEDVNESLNITGANGDQIKEMNADLEQLDATAREDSTTLEELSGRVQELGHQLGMTSESISDDFNRSVEEMRASGYSEEEILNEMTIGVNHLSAQMNDAGDAADTFAARMGDIGEAAHETATQVDLVDLTIEKLYEQLSTGEITSVEAAHAMSAVSYSLQQMGMELKGTADDASALHTIISAAGGDVDTFDKNISDGVPAFIAFAAAAHDMNSSVGSMLIPLSYASFGITGIATAIHLVVMGVFEFLAVFVPAMIAGGAAALVMMQGVGVVADGLKSMYTATEALGPTLGATSGDMLGLGHSLQTAQNDANPGVYELLGETIIGLQRATGPTTDGLSAFGQMGLSVERIMQNFAANIDVGLASSMSTIRSVVSGGVEDLTEFGQILGNIGHAILNLAADMPGLAEIILKLIDGFTQLIKWVSDLPPMLITVAFGIEETYRWSGLLAGALGVLGRGLALIGTLGVPIFAKIGMNFGSMVASMLSGVAGLVANLATGFARIAEGASAMAKAMDAQALAGGIDAAASAVEEGAIGIVGALSKAAEFMTGPWGAAIALAVVGLGILVFWMSRSTPTATQIFIDNINKAVAAASNLTVLNVIGESMMQVTNHIAQQGQIMSQSMHAAAESAQATVGPYQASSTALQSSVGPYNSAAVNADHLTSAQKTAADAASQSVGPYNSQTNAMKAAAEQTRGAVGVYGTIPTAAASAGIAISELTTEQQKLFTEATNVVGGAQTISKAYGTDFTSALGIADIAGVNLSSTQVKLGADANAAGIKIEGLVEGYTKMGQTGSILSNSMAAVNVQAGIQASKVGALNQAWDAFMSMSQSLTGGIASVNADLSQMGNIAPVVGGKITALSGQTSLSVGQIAQSLKSFSGQSAQTWQSYNTALSGAETYTDSLRTGMAAGAVSGSQYKQAIASVAQEFLPYAANSSAARSELDVLLQEAGQPFTNNFSQMKSWIDKNAVSTGNFTSMIDNLTAKLSNVGAVAKNFAGTLQSDVIGAIAQAAVSTSNITGLASAYTKALAANGAQAGVTKAAQEGFNATLIKLGFSQTDVNQLDSELTTGYGKQATAAATLKGATDAAGTSVSNLANNHIAPATSAIDTIKAHTDDFGKALSPGLTGSLTIAGSGADGLSGSHISPLRSALDTVKAHTDDFGQSLNPGLTTSMAEAGHGADDLSTSHLSPARTALDTIKAHTDDFGQSLDPGLTNAIGTTGSRMDDWRTSHLGPGQTAVDTIKAHTDDFGRSLDPGLTGSMDTAGSHSDTLKGSHLTPLQQIVQDLNRFVGDFETAMGKWPSSEATKVTVSGAGGTKVSSNIPGAASGIIQLDQLGLARGGVIPGYAPGQDTVPAMLSPGEGVITPEAVKSMGGADAIDAINRNTQHFASGGIVLPNVIGWAQGTLNAGSKAITEAFQTEINDAVKYYKQQEAMSGPMGGATGSEMQNGAELYQYLLKNVFAGNKFAAAGAIASIWGESTWNPFSVNCVPLTYKIVTTRGILTHDQVQIGDRTPVYNPKTGKVENAKILAVPYHDNAPICVLGNNNWSVICTVDHRWITEDGLVRAYDLKLGESKIMIGDGRFEAVEFNIFIGQCDTFCLTTSTGTWTAYRDEKVAAAEMTEPGPFWTGNTDGRGLIGWTPAGTISNAAFEGGMATQEPAIVQFISSSGDWGVIEEMRNATSVAQAANEWGVGVERYGINDVHAEGIALATSIMNSGGSAAPAQKAADAIARVSRSTQDAGGWVYPGLNLIDNKTGGIERTLGPNDTSEGHIIHNVVNLDGKTLFESMDKYAYQRSSRNNGNANANKYWAPGNR